MTLLEIGYTTMPGNDKVACWMFVHVEMDQPYAIAKFKGRYFPFRAQLTPTAHIGSVEPLMDQSDVNQGFATEQDCRTCIEEWLVAHGTT